MFVFYFYVFSSTKLEKRRAEQVLQGMEMALVGGGRWQEKGQEDE
jgi:hypothetical protein